MGKSYIDLLKIRYNKIKEKLAFVKEKLPYQKKRIKHLEIEAGLWEGRILELWEDRLKVEPQNDILQSSKKLRT